ncbi:MAG: putative nucleotidyltransferase [Pirellulaceae bacterium]|jgi:predicted nucleotidyltransferase
MTQYRRTIQTGDRRFVIPAGSQVVLLNDVSFPGESSSKKRKNTNADRPHVKKAGTVGVVMACPPHNGAPYTVRFTDQRIALLGVDELSLRREEVDSALFGREIEWTKYVIYSCRVGSRAFGLATEESDDDIRGIFLPPANLHWSLYSIPEQFERNEHGDDIVYWELEKYVRLALKANPNVLETLWTPQVLHIEPIAEELLDIREAFLSKHIYKTYSGYVLSQFRRMHNSYRKTGDFKAKHAMHLIRLLYSGISALRDQSIMVDVSLHRETLLEIKRGEWDFERVQQCAMKLDAEFQTVFGQTELPEQPDYRRVDEFLIRARRSMVDDV